MRIGPFHLVERAGRGAMGEVWRALHSRTGTVVALKALPGAQVDPKHRALFRREVRAVARLDHPNVVRILDQGEVSPEVEEQTHGRWPVGTPWMAMEFASGGSLADERAPSTWPGLRDTLEAVLAALAHAHARGVVHRDLKPSNLLRCLPGDARPGIKLADFGIAAMLEGDTTGALAPRMGTLRYMAPEQLDGRWRSFGPWTDLFPVGAIAYRGAFWHMPFEGTTVEAIHIARFRGPSFTTPAIEVPRGFVEWLERMLATAPSDRFASAALALEALHALDEGRTAHDPIPVCSTWPRHVESLRTFVDVGLALHGLRRWPLVGRETERAALWSGLGLVARGRRPRLVILRGAAGVGASRLAAWVAESAHEAGCAEVLTLRLVPGRSAGSRLERMVAETVARRAPPEPDGLAPWLGCGQLDAPARAVRAAIQGGAEHWARVAAVKAVIGALGRPVVWWVDDLHEGLALEQVLRAVLADRTLPVLIVATVHAEATGLDELIRDTGALLCDLAPLAAEDRAVLLRRHMGLEDGLAAQLEARSAGNPLYLVQMVAHWAQQGALTATDAGWVLDSDPGIPALAELWRLRLDSLVGGLSRAAHEALEIAAALGQEVDEDELERAVGAGPAADLEAAVISARLGAPRSGGFAFATALVRDEILARCRDGGRLPGVHARCARALMALGDPDPGRRGAHLLAADAPLEAIAPLARAAVHGHDRRQQRAAVELWRDALERGGIGHDDPHWGRLWGAQARVLRLNGDLDGAIEVARRLIAAAQEHHWEWERDGMVQLAQAALEAGELDLAEPMLRDLRTLAEATGDAWTSGQAAFGQAGAAQLRSDTAASRTLLYEALRWFETAGTALAEADCHRNLGLLELEDGNLDAAEAELDQARRHYASRPGADESVALCTWGLGRVARLRGQLDGAELLLRDAERKLARLGSGYTSFVRAQLGLVALARADVDKARRYLALSRDAAKQQRRAPLEVVSRAGLLAALARDGDEATFNAEHWALLGLLLADAPADPDAIAALQLAASHGTDARRVQIEHLLDLIAGP